jgi:DNA-binding transcriptional MerR regulator
MSDPSDLHARGPLPPKLYFRIGEVASVVGVEPHVLRYWEREFRTIRPSKSAKGQRVYSRRDVENLLRVRDLLYGQGFTIAGARKRLREKGAPDDAVEAEGAVESSGPATDRTPAPAVAVQVETVTDRAALPALAMQPERRVAGWLDARARTDLEALKAEVETFLAELGGAP